MRSREVLMCSDRYADDIPLRLPKTQLPPTRSLFSKQPNGIPASFSFFAAAMPDEPAPMTQAVGSSRVGRGGVIGEQPTLKVTGGSNFARGRACWRARGPLAPWAPTPPPPRPALG